jgi:hypothetical protein
MLAAGEELGSGDGSRRSSSRSRQERRRAGGRRRPREIFIFIFCFFLRNFLFFVKSVNGEKSKTKPNWNGPKFLGCPKVSTKI